MNSTTTRLLKEARILFWPWCVVTIGGALRLIPHTPSHHALNRFLITLSDFSGLCAMLGLPLLATLSLGEEFRHGTLSLLLCQPANRMRIWAEKMSVTLIAVLSAALIHAYAWRGEMRDPRPATLAVVALIALSGSAVYWTLVGKSTMGGLGLNVLVQYVVIGGEALLVQWMLGPNPSPAEMRFVLSIGTLIALCYAGLMLWLGRRKLAHFQVTGGASGGDSLMTLPIRMPQALAGWFRCRSTGGALNLIRKELRLQRPIWLILPVAVLGWICFIACGIILPNPVPPSRVSRGFKVVLEWDHMARHAWESPVSLIGAIAGLIAMWGGGLIQILAGSLAVGEERSWGTLSWHMTLPVSARRQWLVKLVMAMFTSLFCTALLPVAVAGGVSLISGSPWWLSEEFLNMLAWSSLVTLGTFWCACAVTGTSRAAMSAVPALAAVYLAGLAIEWSGQSLEPASGSLRDFAIASFHLSPFAFTSLAGAAAAFWVVPTSLLAVIQSYWMFRAQPQSGSLQFLHSLLWLTMVALLCSFTINASGFGRPVSPLFSASSGWRPLREVQEATMRLQPRLANLSAEHPLQMGADDLPGAGSLSPLTRRWLRGSRITVAPDSAHAGSFATIHTTLHLAGGPDCHWRIPVTSTGKWSSSNSYLLSCGPVSR